ncbi:hypothetical protein D3C71_762710 [compost metagenome]|jgi:hypothetical protein
MELQLHSTALMGLVAGTLAWGYARAVHADRRHLVRWAFTAAVSCFLLGVLFSVVVERPLVQELLARKSLLGLALFLMAGASIAGLLNVLCRWFGADDA